MSEWKPDICIYHGGCDDGSQVSRACLRRQHTLTTKERL